MCRCNELIPRPEAVFRRLSLVGMRSLIATRLWRKDAWHPGSLRPSPSLCLCTDSHRVLPLSSAREPSLTGSHTHTQARDHHDDGRAFAACFARRRPLVPLPSTAAVGVLRAKVPLLQGFALLSPSLSRGLKQDHTCRLQEREREKRRGAGAANNITGSWFCWGPMNEAAHPLAAVEISFHLPLSPAKSLSLSLSLAASGRSPSSPAPAAPALLLLRLSLSLHSPPTARSLLSRSPASLLPPLLPLLSHSCSLLHFHGCCCRCSCCSCVLLQSKKRKQQLLPNCVFPSLTWPLLSPSAAAASHLPLLLLIRA